MSDYINLSKADINYVGYGVDNCGNSCFFNSVNQMLFHIPELRHFLINNKSKFSDPYLVVFIELLNKMLTTRQIILRTDIICNNKILNEFYCDTQEKIFRILEDIQQDAGEYLMFMLNLFNEHFYYNNNNIIIPKIRTPINNLGKSYVLDQYSNIYSFASSFDFFYHCKLETKTYCKNDKNKISNEKTEIDYTPFFNLDDTKKTILGNNNYIYEVNQLNLELEKQSDIYNQYQPCEDNSIDTFKKYNYFPSNNKYLFLNINITEENVTKTSVTINGTQIIQSNLNKLPNFNFKGKNYELIGTIIHSGRLGGGHYWYNHKINNQWYTFNDSRVSSGFEYTARIENGVICYSDNIRILLFREIGKTYNYLKYDYDIINKHILNNVKNTFLTNVNDVNYLDINIKILADFTYYLNKNKKYVVELTQLITNLKRNIAGLLI
jgi:hypothetical protein